MISKININAILSDPLLMIAAVLLILGPLVFLIALVNMLRSRNKTPLDLPSSDLESPPMEEAPPAPPEMETVIPPTPAAPESPPMQTEPARPAPTPPSEEVQGQFEIVFSQIKTLNRKIAQLESEMETVSRTASAKLETNELRESPTNPSDFTQKLLKLAEHVIVLEKEVARLKAERNGGNAVPSAPGAPEPSAGSPTGGGKPPIMPI